MKGNGIINAIEEDVEEIIEKGEWENWENINLDLFKFASDVYQQGMADCVSMINRAGGDK